MASPIIVAQVEGKKRKSGHLPPRNRSDDISVSRRHAELRTHAHGWLVRALGSTNGAFRKLQKSFVQQQFVKLGHGDYAHAFVGIESQ
jgi:hypothetical protein